MIDQNQIQDASIVVAALSMGFYIGSQWTGIQAFQAYINRHSSLLGQSAVSEVPGWVHTVKSVNAIMLGVFAVSVGIVLVIDYREEA